MEETQKSNAEQVKEFTEQSMGKKLPDRPMVIPKSQMEFINEMVVSELIEGNRDTPGVNSWEEARMMIIRSVFADQTRKEKKLNQSPLEEPVELKDDINIIGGQADALADAIYYILNLAAKFGLNLQPIFDIIQTANMDKKDPDAGWLRSEDGKVLKRNGWKPPNISAEILRQVREGSWN